MTRNLPARFAHLNAAPLPAWLAHALDEYGQREVAGAKSNPRILAYRAEGGTPLGGDDGAVPWCAIFVNAMLARSRIAGSGSAMARSFLKHAAFLKLDKPALGAIAVKSSASRGAAAGHVGFYVGEDGLYNYLLGGNQNDEVNISAFRRSEFLGFLWPASAPENASPWNAGYRLATRGVNPPATRDA